jgi:hypothetical protein
MGRNKVGRRRLFTHLRRGGVLGTSSVEFLEVRLLWPFLGFPRKFARGKLERRPQPTPAAG